MDARLRKSTSISLGILEDGLKAEEEEGRGEGKIWKGRRHGSSDSANMALLVLLYALQGVPLGLSSGSIPFILKERTSYTAIGLFSLAGYPYAMKLLWSPIVDTVFHPAIGCRKSWVLPIQTLLGLLMIFSSSTAQIWLDSANIQAMTTLFFFIVLLAATQDIAVDGWALTLLTKQNIGHASTCQTVGMNIGYFLSFTIFLALNDASFCNRYLHRLPRDHGVLTLASYLAFWGWVSVIVAALLVFKHERSPSSLSSTGEDLPEFHSLSKSPFMAQSDSYLPQYNTAGDGHSHSHSHSRQASMNSGEREREREREKTHDMGFSPKLSSVHQMYRRLWKVATLSHIQVLTTVLLTSKLGVITAEAAGVFKLMEKGVSRETIAMIVLLEFPLELCFAVFAGRWSSRGRPFTPWIAGYALRLCTAALSTLIVAVFPTGGTIRSAPIFYVAIVATGLTTSFASTIMFVAQGTFFARISDSSMGGTYLTLLNTIANLGSAWPKFFVFILIDRLTLQQCVSLSSGKSLPLTCPLNPSALDNPCVAQAGKCVKQVDGFFPLSIAMILLGAAIGLVNRKRLRMLESAKENSWRA